MKPTIFRRILLFFLIFLLNASVVAIPAYLVYQGNKKLILDNLGKTAMDISVTISRFIESDIEQYDALNSIDDYSVGNYDETYYQKMAEIIHNIKNETGALYIYTLKYGNENEFIYVLDAEDPSSENFSPLGSTEPVWEELVTCYEQGIATFSAADYDSVWKVTMVTGLSPIIDPETQTVIGVVGVDFDYTVIRPLLTRLGTLIIFGSSLFVLALAIMFFHLTEARNEALEMDYLTNLFSKRYFDRHLRISIIDARHRNQPLAMMMIDVDSFKSINDQFGHLVGDKILSQTAKILRASIRNSDICARYGGDEFSVILPDATPVQAKAVGERILENILLYQNSSEKIDAVPLTLSIGIAEWKDELTPDELINRADSAMYQSKSNGKNKITLFEK